MKKIICLMITGAALWGCGEAASNNAVKQPPSGPPVAKGVNLVPVSAPEDVNNAIRALLINQNDAYLESMKSYCNSGMMADASPASPTTAGSAPSFSSTNIQEAGVDEADILKTDGQYAYALSGKKLKITKVWPASDFKSIGELAITGLPNGMMLVDKTVIVFSNVTKPPSSLPATSKTTMCPVTGCGLGYSGTQVSIVDVKDPAHPSVVRETIYDGRLISQRRVGDKLYLVISSALQMANNIDLAHISYNDYPQCDANGKPANTDAWNAKIEDIKKQNHDIIGKMDFSNALPGVPDKSSVRAYASPLASDTSVMQVITVSTQAMDDANDIVMVLGGANTVYASEKSLYVADSHPYGDDTTLIHHFSLDPKTDYAGSTKIDGHLINQFAMSEYNDVLRVATTTGQPWGESSAKAESTVYTLDASSRDLAELGKVAGLGKGEKIYSVRFIGPRGFVVTFKKIDPLFVLNLRDPKNPSIMGELKVPGVSTYLHPMGDNHLIGVGPNVLTNGNSVDGFKLSLFDVSNSAAPKEIQSVVIGKTWMSMSLAMSDHHAFTFDPKSQLLALPVSIGESYKSHKEGMNLYRVSADKGFELLGSNVTTDGSSVLRTILMEDAQHSAVLSLQSVGLSLHQRDAQLTTEGTVIWSDVSTAQTMMLVD